MKPIATLNGYVVSEASEQKRTFISKVERAADGTESKTSFPISINKRRLQLQHPCGDIVLFTSYVYKGEWRYKDSRDKVSKPYETPDHVISELQRMLLIDHATAKSMIPISEVDWLKKNAA